jgi:restriction system protein
MKEHPKVYMARAGSNGEDEQYALDNDLAVIGFREFGSLENLKDWEQVSAFVRKEQPDMKPHTAGNLAGQLWAFSISMQEGDIVVLPSKLSSQVALGIVTGPYQYLKVGDEFRHTRAVKWVRPDVPRTAFQQDLLLSFGAYMTVCRITRNGAEKRIAAVLNGSDDPGLTATEPKGKVSAPVTTDEAPDTLTDLAQLAHDQIVAHIQSHYPGHAMTRLVDAVLRADGWVTKVSPPGPDGGVDILAGRGTLGLDAPRLCVQVKSQNSPADVTIYRTLQGTMQTFKAEQGLLVCWGGYNKVVLAEAKQSHFTVRLWESRDLVEAILRNYEKLPAEIQAELPLKRVWTLVAEEIAE